MAILFIDGFDHYGLTETNMTAGLWSTSPGILQTATVRTETHAYELSNASIPTNTNMLRRSLNGAKATVGIGQARYMSTLPDDSDGEVLVGFSDIDNNTQLVIVCLADGNIRVSRNNGGSSFVTSKVTLTTTSTPPLTALAWHHIECKVTISDASGAVEVRVNGVSVINITGVDTKATANAEVSNVHFGADTASGHDTFIDDVFAWDTTGSNNNDFIGDRKVYFLSPTSDTAETDWVRNTGSDDYAAIDDLEQDGDTTYLESSTVGDISEFGLENLPASVGSVSCIYVAGMYKKTDAGDGSIKQSMVAGGSPSGVAAGDSQAITTTYTYWDDVFETDPSTGALWTAAGVNAALLRIERTL